MAHTLVVGATATNKATGRKADVVLAAHYAGQAALRLLTAGKNVRVTYICCINIYNDFFHLFRIMALPMLYKKFLNLTNVSQLKEC